MTPQQQAVVAALQAAGIDASKLDGAGIDKLLATLMPAAPAPAPVANADPNAAAAQQKPAVNADDPNAPKPATNAEPDKKPPVAANADAPPAKNPPACNSDDPTDPAKMSAAKFSEAIATAVEKAVAAKLAPLNARLATADAAKDRAEVAAFCERFKDRILPYEMDPKANGGVTLVDLILAQPAAAVATFGEGKLSPRAAFLKQIENRKPDLATYAEKIPAPTANQTAAEAAVAGLAASPLGKRVLEAKQAEAKKQTAEQAVAQFAENLSKQILASRA